MTPGGEGGTSTNPVSADFVNDEGYLNDMTGYTPYPSSNLYVRPAITFKATEIQYVNVSFKSEGISDSNLPKTQRIYKGGYLNSVPELTREGYDFLGWYKTGDDKQVLINSVTTFSEDTELTALWAKTGSDATTDENGVAELTNPAANIPVKVTVQRYTSSESYRVATAMVLFSDTGELTVKFYKSSYYDGSDIKVSVVSQADDSPIPGINCTVTSTDGAYSTSGTTATAEGVTDLVSEGELLAHFNVKKSTVVDDSCECTGSTFEVEQCDTCKSVLSTTTIVEAKGHPQDQLVDYGTDSAAKECKRCGHVLFGTWEQDGDEASKETIEWLKLGSQTCDGTQLLLSLYALEYKQFDPSGIMWSSSQIRSWLNTDADGFYSSAFTTSEKSKINETTLSDVSTTDNVFLLSNNDAGNTTYFKDENARECYMTPAIFDKSFMTSSRISSWWLRSTRTIASGTGVAYIYKNNISGDKPTCVLGIRPAFYFKVS